MKIRKKLIEVALPLDAINKASQREKSIRHGHPSTLHLWWARRPLAAARAVLFAQLVDDPSSVPEEFPSSKQQDEERKRLFGIIEQMVKWENTNNERVLEQAREEIRKSWLRACRDNADHPRAEELFNPEKLPPFRDPFAGGGSIPLEAQRLGLEAHASDLNPVAVLINKAMIEIPPRFAGKAPVNPEIRSKKELFSREWKGAQGLAEDVRYYGRWMRDEAQRRIGHLYPKVKITEEMVGERPDLKKYLGQELTVIAWLWARTVRSPNPAFSHVHVPLVSTFMLATKKGKEAYVEPVIKGDSYEFKVRVGKPKDVEKVKRGTKTARGANFECIISGAPITGDYIKSEGRAGRMKTRLMAIVLEGENERVYVSPIQLHERISEEAKPCWKPETPLAKDPRALWTPAYGLKTFGDLFTPRQLVALTTFSDLVGEAIGKARKDAVAAGLPDDDVPLRAGGTGARAYAEAVGVYLGIGLDKITDYNTTLVIWSPSRDQAKATFARQALPMVWDFVEVNPFARAAGDLVVSLEGSIRFLSSNKQKIVSTASQEDATKNYNRNNLIYSTDPPYYDNIGYADLSDFFYVWLRRSLKNIFPDLFATVGVPKAEELVATPYRHGSKEKAERFFLDGMTKAMGNIARNSHPAFPVTIYYAFKQTEKKQNGENVSTGWETFLDALMEAGFSMTGSWPIRTERGARALGIGTNALASSIILVCRPRGEGAGVVTKREFISELERELPEALRQMQRENIAPVDLQQAAIGPGMAVFTKYEKVIDTEGNPMTVREALSLINQVLDETLAEQEAEYDADTRWAVAWFEQYGFDPAEFGVAETLTKAKNTSVAGLVEAGILEARRGKVRLLRPEELDKNWSPETDKRLTVWEMVHHLIRILKNQGEPAAADILARLGGRAEAARELTYRLYNICQKKKRAEEAIDYNSLAMSWPEIARLARAVPQQQQQLL